MRSNRSLLVRLLAPYLFVLVAGAASLYAYSDRVVESLYLETLSDTVLRQARLAGELLPWDLRGGEMDKRCAAVAAAVGARVTVIATDGTVIGDSDVSSATLESHHDRPEIHAAFADGDGWSVRVSAGVDRPLFFRAWRQTRDHAADTEQRVVQLAVPMATVDDPRHRIRVAIWGGVVVAALAVLWPALVLSRRLSQRVDRLTDFSTAVATGEPLPPLRPEGDDTIGRLEGNLIAMAESLRARFHAASEEKGKLEAVLAGMIEGVLVIDRSGTVQLANQRAADLFDHSQVLTLIGEPLINLSRDPDLHALVRAVLEGRSGRDLVREINLSGADGREDLHVTATPITEPAGAPRLFILVFHHVTELKKLEATRRDFVANVSHELRTPLTAIRGYAENLRTGALNDPALAAKFVSVIERHSERLSRLIDDLLTLSDLELGRTELQRAPMPLPAAVDAAVEVVREKAVQGQVELRRELPPDLPQLYADADRVTQVLVNLIDNAVKYTRAGGQVTVNARMAELPSNGTTPTVPEPRPPGPWIEIRIVDTGIGIPSQDLPRLTERFYRVDKARSRELGGTGLGLAIVKHIVQLHGGALRIDSELGHGTCVRVFLPAVT